MLVDEVEEFGVSEDSGDGAEALADLLLEELVGVGGLFEEAVENGLEVGLEAFLVLVEELVEANQAVLGDGRAEAHHAFEEAVHGLGKDFPEVLLVVLGEGSHGGDGGVLGLPGLVLQSIDHGH